MLAVKLLANSAVTINCYIVLNMPSVFTFHISHITWDIILQLVDDRFHNSKWGIKNRLWLRNNDAQ